MCVFEKNLQACGNRKISRELGNSATTGLDRTLCLVRFDVQEHLRLIPSSQVSHFHK